MHNNLFAWAVDEREVYDALQRDAKRDIRVRQVLNVILFGAVVYLTRDLPPLDRFAALAGIWAALTGLHYFIDASNRNFWMHHIDWMRATSKDG